MAGWQQGFCADQVGPVTRKDQASHGARHGFSKDTAALAMKECPRGVLTCSPHRAGAPYMLPEMAKPSLLSPDAQHIAFLTSKAP